MSWMPWRVISRCFQTTLSAFLSGHIKAVQGCTCRCFVAVIGTSLRVWLSNVVACTKQGLRKTLEVPRSVGGLVTKRLLVMNFIEGDQITRLAHRTRGLSQRWAIHSWAPAGQFTGLPYMFLDVRGSKLKSDWTRGI